MTTLVPRKSYSQEELEKLYPKELSLQLVQILMRHGERSPVSPRFQNAGLRPYWPYCNAARKMASVIKSGDASQWDELKWRRRLEIFGDDDSPVVASGPGGEFDAVCQPGELTDQGRDTTLKLGQRLRHLYVNQLGFMPHLIADADMIYLRATPMPRALESVQQAFWGLYPPSSRTADFPPPTILTRSPADETLYPNDANCRRFAQLSRAFAQRCADRWNDSDDMAYLTKMFGKWMASDKVAVDSKPRLSGVLDTVNSTLAHGPETRLPKEFYDPKARAIVDKIAVEEWFAGYNESQEYRTLGIGALMGDVVARMIGSARHKGDDGILEIGGKGGWLGEGRGGEKAIKLAISGCHDTTLAAVLTSLGAFNGEDWPPYTSHVAIEMFKQKGGADTAVTTEIPTQKPLKTQPGWLKGFFGFAKGSSTSSPSVPALSRKPMTAFSAEEKENLKDYFVRVRFNDKVMQIPSCAEPGNHFQGNHSICTLEAFKSVVDKYTPENWKGSCSSNLDQPAFPEKTEWAGY